jgi:hypothetical protein
MGFLRLTADIVAGEAASAVGVALDPNRRGALILRPPTGMVVTREAASIRNSPQRPQ